MAVLLVTKIDVFVDCCPHLRMRSYVLFHLVYTSHFIGSSSELLNS